MERIQKHLDGMFKELPRNEAADRIKAEMLENLTERYEELLAQTGSAEEAERQVIAEIGTAEEIREAILLASPKKRPIVTILQVAAVALSLGYAIFERITREYNRERFYFVFGWILASVALPLLFFYGATLGMKIINRYAQPDGLIIKNKKLRMIFLIISIAFLMIFGLASLNIVINLLGCTFVFFPATMYNFIFNNSYLFGVAAVLFYLGRKK